MSSKRVTEETSSFQDENENQDRYLKIDNIIKGYELKEEKLKFK